MNVTKSCSGNGECELYGSVYHCSCNWFWDFQSNCVKSYFDVWHGVEVPYLGVIVSLGFIGFSIVLFEIICDIRSEIFGHIWRTTPKILCTLFFLCEMSSHIILFKGTNSNVNQLVLPHLVLLAVSRTSSLSAYIATLLYWSHWASRKSHDFTEHFRHTKKGLIIILLIFFPIYLSMSLLNFFLGIIEEGLIMIISSTFASVYLLVLALWSSIYMVRLHDVLVDDVDMSFYKKKYLGGSVKYPCCVEGGHPVCVLGGP